MNQKEPRGERMVGKFASLYEKLCNSSYGILKVKVDERSKLKLAGAIEFSDLRITPESVFSLTLLSLLFALAFSAVILALINVTIGLIFMIVGVCGSLYFYFYPTILARTLAIKMSSESILVILYMVISMKMSPNLENAVKFAIDNVYGPIGYDLKRMLWGVYTGKFASISEAMRGYIKRWSFENKEFAEALNLINASIASPGEKRDEMLDEAVNTILNGTEEKMKRYGRELGLPVMIVNTLGIILPVVGLTLTPLVVVFLPGGVKPMAIILIYNIILPVMIYVLMNFVLYKRPWTFSQPDISEHPESVPRGKFLLKSGGRKVLIPSLLLALLVGIGVASVGIFGYLFRSGGVNSFTNVVYTSLIVLGAALGMSTYFLTTSYQNLKIRDDIKSVESELGEVLFEVSSELGKGIPLEMAIAKPLEHKELKISGLFQRIVNNIRNLGVTFERALFDPEQGAIKYYPSKLMGSIMKVVSEASKRSALVLSETMKMISNYLRKVHSVEERLRDTLSETTSSMKFQAMGLTPVAAGIVLSLTFVIVSYMAQLETVFAGLEEGGRGIGGTFMSSSFGIIVNLSEVISVESFQLIIGFYMLEMVVLITIFQSTLENGEERISRNFSLGVNLMVATILYVILFLLISTTLGGLLGSALVF